MFYDYSLAKGDKHSI